MCLGVNIGATVYWISVIKNIEQCYGGSGVKMLQPRMEKASMSLDRLAACVECLHVPLADGETEISKPGLWRNRFHVCQRGD